jgi:hypothetical protein
VAWENVTLLEALEELRERHHGDSDLRARS